MRIAPTSRNMDIYALQLLNKLISKSYMSLGQSGFDFWCISSEEYLVGRVNTSSLLRMVR